MSAVSGLLGLACRAGQISLGADMALQEIRSGNNILTVGVLNRYPVAELSAEAEIYCIELLIEFLNRNITADLGTGVNSDVSCIQYGGDILIKSRLGKSVFGDTVS